MKTKGEFDSSPCA